MKQIKTFRVVYQEKSLSKAAKSLFISQQALSKQIAALERELDTQLFERVNPGMVPTALGTLLYKETEYLVKGFDEILVRFEEAKQAQAKKVTLCVEKGLLRNRPDVFPSIIWECRSRKNHPFELVVDDLDGDECRMNVAAGKRNLALVVSSTGSDVGDLATKLGNIEVFIGVHRENPVALSDRLEPEAIESLKIALPNEVTRTWMEQVLRDYGCLNAPEFVAHARDTMNLDGFVLTYCDAIISWSSLLFANSKGNLRFYPIGYLGLYLIRSPFFYDEESTGALQCSIGARLSLF